MRRITHNSAGSHLSSGKWISCTLAVTLGVIWLFAPLSQVHATGSSLQTVVSEQESFVVNILARGLDHPWGMTFLPDGQILITERSGALRLVTQDGLHPTPIGNPPPSVDRGQGGLLDVVLGPDFDTTGFVYFSHSARDESGMGTRVTRMTLESDASGRPSHLVDPRIIFEARPFSSGGRHFGSRLVWADDGTLLVSVGDRGDADRSQDLGDAAGKIHRINADGSVPPDNPFIGQEGMLPTIYSYGNRNAQGMEAERGTGRIWAHEHGPRGGDEVNIIRPGVNYGWPVITHGRAYSGFRIGDGISEHPDMAQPVIHWTPSIAPSGLALYTGTAFPNWSGDLFAGSLRDEHVRRMERSADGESIIAQEILLSEELGRIRAVSDGPDGFLYLLTDESDGMLVRLEPTGS